MITILHIDAIASDPLVRSGRPVVAGTGICVSDIAANYIFERQTPEMLAAGFRLTLGQVHAALAYYFTHQAEIDAELKANQAEADKLLEQLRQQGKVITLE